MKTLLHICCAPCAIYPAGLLRDLGHELTGFWYNHNIHPFQEYMRRLDAVRDFSAKSAMPMLWRDDYALEEFLGAVATDPDSRCGYCYASRMRVAAATAAENGCEAFTTSLLYSRYQNHAAIRALGEQLGGEFGLVFVYDDFRKGWQEGIRLSKEMGLYRQQYCGCIYSEKERYAPKQGGRP